MGSTMAAPTTVKPRMTPAAWGDGSGAACSSPDTWSSDCVDLSARSGWASFMSFCVVVFPAMDVLSAYPLKAITLGNTLFSGLCGDAMVLHTVTSPLPSAREMLGWACRRGRRSIPTASLATPLAPPPSPPASSYGGAPVREERQGLLRTEGAGEAARSPGWRAWVLASNSRVWTLRTACRLVAAAPPVLGAAIESDIGTIIAYTGILGVVIAFIVPAYLQLASIASMSKAAAAALRKDSGDATPAAPSAAGAAAVNSSPAAGVILGFTVVGAAIVLPMRRDYRRAAAEAAHTAALAGDTPSLNGGASAPLPAGTTVKSPTSTVHNPALLVALMPPAS